MKACYHPLPTEKEFLHSIQGQEEQVQEEDNLEIMARFAMEKRRLEVL